MADILEEIVAYKHKEIAGAKQLLPGRQLHSIVESMLDQQLPSMREALMKSSAGIIAEFKRKSPSKGWIHQDAQADIVPLSYQQKGATALSILTDEHFFGGNDSFIVTARQSGVTIPILYKNFIVDEYQLFQARKTGASTVLLIAAAVAKDECKHLLHMAHELGLEVLLEMHNKRDIEYAEYSPDLYGINNRDLGSFHTNVQNSFDLVHLLPQNVCKVSESGIDNPDTIKHLRAEGYKGFLMGEAFMHSEDPGMALQKLIAQL